MRSPQSVERDFIAYEKYNLFPQAKLHTQWPGSGTVGDPIFDQFMAETLPMIGDATVREALNRDATIALLDRIGPAILMPHSQSAAPVADLIKRLSLLASGTCDALYCVWRWDDIDKRGRRRDHAGPWQRAPHLQVFGMPRCWLALGLHQT
jgi:hypothetical protein